MSGILSQIAGFFNPAPTGVFAGKVVAFTGTLQSGNRKITRTEAQRIVKSMSAL
jgi:hypothetical protein